MQRVIESRDGKNLISWAEYGDIKIWDKALLNPIPERILLLLTVYSTSPENPMSFKTGDEWQVEPFEALAK